MNECVRALASQFRHKIERGMTTSLFFLFSIVRTSPGTRFMQNTLPPEKNKQMKGWRQKKGGGNAGLDDITNAKTSTVSEQASKDEANK